MKKLCGILLVLGLMLVMPFSVSAATTLKIDQAQEQKVVQEVKEEECTGLVKAIFYAKRNKVSLGRVTY